MKTVCPDCGRSFALEQYPDAEQETWCSECGNYFHSEANIRFGSDLSSRGMESESFVVEWQVEPPHAD